MIFHVDIISGRGSKTKRLLYTIFKVQITIFNAYFRRDSLNERVVDLMIPFKAKWYDDPRCEGSASIKKVLPVVCPELSYKDLGIQNGATASIRWYDAIVGNVPEDQAKKIYQDLLKYCCLDTLAMVKIYEYLGQFTPAYEQYR